MNNRSNPGGAVADVTKQELVYRELRERILSGTYGPGFRIVLDAVAEEFAVSPLPVREAIRRLEAEGLVVYTRHVGARVTPADPGAYDDEMSILAVLEGYATSLAAPLLTEADLAELVEKNDAMTAAIDRLDPLSFGRLNREFHEIIYARCPNASLVASLEEVSRRLDAIRRTVFVQIPYRGSESVAEHAHLIRLLAGQADPAEIDAAARAHKMATVDSFRAWKAQQDPDS